MDREAAPDRSTAEGGSSSAEAAAKPPAPAPRAEACRHKGRRFRRVFWALAALAAVGVAGYFLYPRAVSALTTVSTDDAYVNSHVTHVAPMVAERVLEVRVDDNDFVRKGDRLVVLDNAMKTIQVEERKASLETARRQLEQAQAKARAAVALAKASRFKLAAEITRVKNRAVGLRAAVARLEEARASEKLAKTEAGRYQELASRRSVSQEQADIRQADYDRASARVRELLEDIRGQRVALELPAEPPEGRPLDDVPPGLDQRVSSVLAQLGELSLNLAALGVPLPGYYDSPDQFIAGVRKTAPNGDIDALIEETVKKAPDVAVARSQVEQAGRAVAQAELELSYCEVRADVDGFVFNRSVNVGNRVAAGQRLMAIRSFAETWVEGNFKETQLAAIRIGQPVDVYVDAYPGKVFRGRVSGFSTGTGAATSLFPAQNATGNFVKIVQRLPVRIDLVGGNPKDTPLFIGLSAVPYVRVYERPEGPNAGQRLRGDFPRVETAESPFSRLNPPVNRPGSGQDGGTPP